MKVAEAVLAWVALIGLILIAASIVVVSLTVILGGR